VLGVLYRTRTLLTSIMAYVLQLEGQIGYLLRK